MLSRYLMHIFKKINELKWTSQWTEENQKENM